MQGISRVARRSRSCQPLNADRDTLVATAHANAHASRVPRVVSPGFPAYGKFPDRLAPGLVTGGVYPIVVGSFGTAFRLLLLGRCLTGPQLVEDLALLLGFAVGSGSGHLRGLDLGQGAFPMARRLFSSLGQAVG